MTRLLTVAGCAPFIFSEIILSVGTTAGVEGVTVVSVGNGNLPCPWTVAKWQNITVIQIANIFQPVNIKCIFQCNQDDWKMKNE